MAANSAFGFLTEGFQNDLWNPIDFLAPGTTFLNNMFDPTGSRAAATAYAQNFAMQKDQQEYNRIEAERQRAWEEQMSNTAYQRAAKDLQAAGFNPAAMFLHGGSAASTPSGSVATSGANNAPLAQNKLAVAAGLIATALKFFLTK